MENITNNYMQDTGIYLQSSSEQNNGTNLPTNCVLDLSYKTPTKVANQGTAIDLSRPSSVGAKRQYQQLNPSKGGRQSPIAGASAISSPYPEPNSPKRRKIESSCENSNQSRYLTTLMERGISPVVTMITHPKPEQPSLPMLSSEAIQVPAMPTISVPSLYAETPQSFLANSEASSQVSISSQVTVPSQIPESTDAIVPSLDVMKKASRPFKAYPKELLPGFILEHKSDENFVKYRQSLLETMKKMRGNTSNSKMRRVSNSPGLPTSTIDEKDNPVYREKRRKNNEAAKRSRDARRAKEDELAIRATYLEHENTRLRQELQNYQCVINQLQRALLENKRNELLLIN